MALQQPVHKKFEFEYLPIKKIGLWSKVNVRKTDAYVGIEDLAASIKEIGVQQPLLVKKVNRRYRVFSGQRRYIAAGKAKLDEVPCLILKDIDNFSATVISFTENIQRLDMTDEDKAKAAYELKKKLKTNQAVADKIGVSPSTISRWLSWYEVPEKIKKFVADKKMNFDTARYISSKYEDDSKFAYDVAKEYVNKKKEEKSDFFVAIKNSNPADSISKVHKEFRQIKSSIPYTIRLPTDESKIITDMAKDLHTSPNEIIVKIVIRGISLYNKGRWQF